MIESVEITFTDGETHTISWEEDAWECEDRRVFTKLDEAVLHAFEKHNEEGLRLQQSTLMS